MIPGGNFTMIFNTALIGKGYWGSKLEAVIRENPNFSLLKVCDSKSNLEKEVYHNSDIQAVVIASPTPLHYQMAKSSLLSGKHVFSEKPLSLRYSESSELLSISENKDLVLMTDYIHTFSQSINLAREIISSGDLGQIKSITMSMKQLGRFGREDVYWLLGSHMLAVLDKFVPLNLLNFRRTDWYKNNSNVESGEIYFSNSSLNGIISLSLNNPEKERKINFHCEKGALAYNPLSKNTLSLVYYETQDQIGRIENFSFNESENLKIAVESFYKSMIKSIPDNATSSVQVTRVLDELHA